MGPRGPRAYGLRPRLWLLLLIRDWPSAKITCIRLAERESAPFAFCRRLEMKNAF